MHSKISLESTTFFQQKNKNNYLVLSTLPISFYSTASAHYIYLYNYTLTPMCLHELLSPIYVYMKAPQGIGVKRKKKDSKEKRTK